jgi:hypothetical protein
MAGQRRQQDILEISNLCATGILTRDYPSRPLGKRQRWRRVFAWAALALLGCLAVMTGSGVDLAAQVRLPHLNPFQAALDWVYPPAPPLPPAPGGPGFGGCWCP